MSIRFCRMVTREWDAHAIKKVNRFKNLVGVDVRFGPFTCVAGPNGVGKSNLFDAIRFLSALADKSLVEAALSVRDDGGRAADLRSIFHRTGNDHERRMTFEAEMIIPSTGMDDLGQEAEASITYHRYLKEFGYKEGANHHVSSTLELLSEALTPIKLGDAAKNLRFEHQKKWRKEVIKGRRTVPFISIKDDDDNRTIMLHQDGGSSGRPLSCSSKNLPRTVLSAANAAESPTALLARREMQSWRLLQLEPSALREPDTFTAPSTLGSNGAH